MKENRNNKNNLFTIEVMKIIGSPFLEKKILDNVILNTRFLEYAVKNKIHLLFLESLIDKNINTYNNEYLNMIERYNKINLSLIKLIDLFNKNNLEYTLFKTIRPYKEVTVDIDIIILSDIKKVINLLLLNRYKLLEIGPIATTFWDNEAQINIDLYEDVGVSHFIYLNKKDIISHIYKTYLIGNSINTLDPVADLLAIISHSIIKEQMYILSEFYTTIYYLSKMTEKDIETLIYKTKKWKFTSALSAHLTITKTLHEKAFNHSPKIINIILKKIGINNNEMNKLIYNKYNIPHKFTYYTLLKSFFEKIENINSRKSLKTQLKKMTNPKFTYKLLHDIYEHISRDRY